MVFFVWTDGHCQGNHLAGVSRIGGIGVDFGGAYAPLCGPASGNNTPNLTNNRAELEACIVAARFCYDTGKSAVRHHTDSQLIVNAMTYYIHIWNRRGWRTSKGQPVQNQDLFQELYELVMKFRHYKFVHVRREDNSYADLLARLGSTSVLETRKMGNDFQEIEDLANGRLVLLYLQENEILHGKNDTMVTVDIDEDIYENNPDSEYDVVPCGSACFQKFYLDYNDMDFILGNLSIDIPISNLFNRFKHLKRRYGIEEEVGLALPAGHEIGVLGPMA